MQAARVAAAWEASVAQWQQDNEQRAAGLSALTPSSAIVFTRRAGEDFPGMEDLPNRRRRVPYRGPSQKSSVRKKKRANLDESAQADCVRAGRKAVFRFSRTRVQGRMRESTEQLRLRCRLLSLATKHKVCQRLHAQFLSAPRRLDPGRRCSRTQGRKRARTGDVRCSKSEVRQEARNFGWEGKAINCHRASW